MKLSKYIDHTLLDPKATSEQIRQLCYEALVNDFASVCVNSCYVSLAASLLHVPGSTVKVCTVVGFPLGAMATPAKVDEAREAIFSGADEIDMVINIGWLKDKEYQRISYELERMRKACGSRILKVILETSVLTDEEIIKACELCKEASADFVKTSTGFDKSGGATVHAVEVMKKACGDFPHIKASGGIRDKETMQAMIDAGATRIGTSHGVDLVK
ncbi:MAG: deoxyribose-phosphate aldolase [Bacilli bacterium]|nr:deoxyribose-phosphate aldolase [Bacilli bacterium]